MASGFINMLPLMLKDEHGKNSCPYCLPRVHNKGKENEYTYYLHAFVNFAFIFPGGLQLPIYIYPLKAEQLQGNEAASEDKHKQECELQAAQIVLPIIKKNSQNFLLNFLQIHFMQMNHYKVDLRIIELGIFNCSARRFS